MNTFTRKTLYAAIAGAATIGVAGTAQAVNVSADGLGQVLIYPYYTVKKNADGQPYNTLMSVVNTTSSTKAVKVRFREGRNSVEVLDFNLFLSPWDVWTAALTPTADGGGQIKSSDKSCTIPDRIQKGETVPFRTLGLESGDNAVTRTAEGYIEIFEMSTATGATAAKALHVNGVPACGITDAEAIRDQAAPNGGLFGGVTIVNPAGGGAFSQPATALANFNPTAAYTRQDIGIALTPGYKDAVPVSNVIQGGTLYSSVWGTGQNAVTAVLLGNAITNEYVLDAGSKSQTSWVITMPTKYDYVNGTTPVPPFTSKYTSGKGACEATFGVVFNREEASPQIVTDVDFSPQVPGTPGPTICWEANVLTFNGGNFFGSANTNNQTTTFSNGWATYGFNDPSAAAVHLMTPLSTLAFNLSSGTTGPATVTYYGLPVVGFAAQTFNNDAIVIGGKTFLSTFAAEFVHHKTTRIQ
jgi:hypothetical protein